MTPAQRIKRAREAKGLSQRELAGAIGVTGGFIGKIESADTLPSYEVCIALTSVLELSLDELWQEVEASRREAGALRLRTRGAVAGRAIRTRGAVRTRGATDARGSAPAASGGGRGPAAIAQDIASDPELLATYLHLRRAMGDPTLRSTVMKTVESLARMADPHGSGGTKQG